MHIFLRSQQTHCFEVQPNDDIFELKVSLIRFSDLNHFCVVSQTNCHFNCLLFSIFVFNQIFIESAENIPTEEQVLYCCGRPLDEEQKIIGSELRDGEYIDVCVRLRGGKVHGSLARAGKVKGQTPKVEKQEKRKKKTGRAKRRMQYNRRFVNVVQTFGRRRGPNTNQQKCLALILYLIFI